MSSDDDKTLELPLIDLEFLSREIGSLKDRLYSLEERFEKRGKNTAPMRDVLAELKQQVDELSRRLPKPVDFVDTEGERKCLYCGTGVYRKVLDTKDLSPMDLIKELEYWGINYKPSDSEASRWWVVFACNHCGALQVFHRFNVQHSPAWNKPGTGSS